MDSLTSADGDFIRHARAEVFDMQRLHLGQTEVLGDLIVAVAIPLLLWNDLPHAVLVAWGVLVGAVAIGWEIVDQLLPDRRFAEGGLHTLMGWAQTIVWGSLPWLALPALSDRGVVWVLVFVVVTAIGVDMIFTTQTSDLALDEMVVAYTLSYLVAFAVSGAYLALVVSFLTYLNFAIAGAGFGQITEALIAKRGESDRMAREDSLTGIGNRTAAIEAVQAMQVRGASEYHCVFVDIDDFKQLNDNYGYQIGDLALCAVAETLVDRLPPGWVVCRFGGDEFVGVGDTGDFDPQSLVDTSISIESHNGLVFSQPLSVGVTSMPAERATADGLFREAAAALRQAKQLGKHQVVEMTDTLRVAGNENVRLGSRAAAALEYREIVPWAQPIVCLRTGKLAGMELLARWPQADGSMVMPDQFVPVIEDQGRGPALGMLMIEHAVSALSKPLLRQTAAFVSVNLSARHLFHRRLPVEIGELLDHAGVRPERLIVEITESQKLQPSPIWSETAAALRHMGVGLAIDDFGKGYSSFDQLLSMPFSHLKIDMLITQSVHRPGASELAAAIVSMAHGAEISTVAEGIETQEQWDAMASAGCTFGQGYLIARPTPLADVLRALADEATWDSVSGIRT